MTQFSRAFCILGTDLAGWLAESILGTIFRNGKESFLRRSRRGWAVVEAGTLLEGLYIS